MKILVLLSMVLVSLSSFAHLEMGTYMGKTDSGEACYIDLLKVEYKFNTKNPLNERIFTRLQHGQNFVVSHPLVFDKKQADISFEKNHLRGVIGLSYGAFVLDLFVSHDEENPGLKSFTFVGNNWEEKTKSQINCRQLIFIGK